MNDTDKTRMRYFLITLMLITTVVSLVAVSIYPHFVIIWAVSMYPLIYLYGWYQ